MKKQADKAPIPEAIAAANKPKLTAQEVEAIVSIVANAPCPGGLPQADARKALLQKFIASQQ